MEQEKIIRPDCMRKKHRFYGIKEDPLWWDIMSDLARDLWLWLTECDGFWWTFMSVMVVGLVVCVRHAMGA